MFEAILFYILSSALILGALGVVFAKEPVHAILLLAFSILNAGGLFLLLGAEFNAMLLIVVYLGSVVILFLFIAMMLGKDANATSKGKTRGYIVVSSMLLITLFAELAYLLTGKFVFDAGEKTAETLSKITNSKAIGLVLYSDYALALQITGIVLLLAMVGAIMLAILPREDAKKQEISRQIEKSAKDEIVLVDLKSGEGI
jgi:NADH-quinone oxidoreductase subunit J